MDGRIDCLLITILLFLGGCANLPETYVARGVEPGERPVLSGSEVLVFGRILFSENGGNKAPYGWSKPIWQLESPERKPVANGQGARRMIIPFLSTRRDGAFAYIIPAGHYEMTHVEPFYYLPFIDPALEFDASAPGRAYYLGDLELDIDTSVWLGGLWGNYITHLNHIEVLDRFEEASWPILANAPGTGAIRKARLTRIHGRIPALNQSAGGILVAPSGGIHFGK